MKKLTPWQLWAAYGLVAIACAAVLAWILVPRKDAIKEVAMVKRVENLHRMGNLYKSKGDFPKALDTFSNAYQYSSSGLPKEHTCVQTSLLNLAILEKLMGNYPASLSNFEELYALRSKLLGSLSPETLNIRINVATLNFLNGNLMEAEEHYRAILEARMQVLGPEDSGTLYSRVHLAWFLRHVNQLEESLTLLDSALAGFEKYYGEEHQGTILTLLDKALTHISAKDFPSAETCLVRILDIDKRMSVGETRRLRVQSILATNYRRMFLFEEALALQETILEERKRTLGLSHVMTAASFFEIALTHSAWGNTREAVLALSQAKMIAYHYLGESHPWFLQIEEELTRLQGQRDLLTSRTSGAD